MKEWGGQRFNTDFEPIDEQGNVLGPKDLGASEGWTNQNEPWRNTPGWHGQPLSAEQSAGIQATNPTGWAEREAWRAANPTTANGAPLGGGAGTGTGGTGSGGFGAPNPFDWSGWDLGVPQAPSGSNPVGDGVSMTGFFGPGPMTVDPTTGQATHGQPQTGGPDPLPQGWGPGTLGGAPTPMPPTYDPSRGNVRGQGEGQGGFGPSQGPQGSAPQLDGPALLSQLGGAPTVAGAGPLSGFGSDVQSSIQQGLGPATVNQNDPAYQAQVDTFRRNEQRSADRTRAALAARANATGTNASGGFDSQIRRVLSNQGAREADFESELMQSELGAARDRQARAQQLGAGLLSQEQAQGLQERLANHGSTLQTMGLQNTRDLANQGATMQTGLANQGAVLQQRGLDNQRYGIDAQAGTSRYGIDAQSRTNNNDALLRRNALMLQQQLGTGDLDLRRLGLTNQNSQYYAGLGQQLGLGRAQMDQDALLALLRG